MKVRPLAEVLTSNYLKGISAVTSDSKLVVQGGAFVAVRGTSVDGHQFLPAACLRKPALVVVEDLRFVPNDFEGDVVQVSSSRRALMELASAYFENPSERLLCFGVTGTNGKTSTSLMIEKIMNDAGNPTGVMGTIDHHLGRRKWESSLTTPDPLVLQGRLREFLNLGARAVAFEVSSHALAQSRADSIEFDVAVFTNLTRDHLDYHQTMEAYFAAKNRLFSELLANSPKKAVFAVVNTDDEWGRKVRPPLRVQTVTYGQCGQDFSFQVDQSDFSGTHFTLQALDRVTRVFFPLVGLHNVYNAVGALAATTSVGVALEQGMSSLREFTGVPGRLERVPNHQGKNVFVDYAHTPDALEKVLAALHSVRSHKTDSTRIFTVFGCGGDRDAGKRPLMMRVAIEQSDVVVLTSDNPRTEDPQKIIADCLNGCPSKDRGRCFVEPDRKSAIALAFSQAHSGDVILIAGKGHEDYQILGTQKIPFSDVQVAKELLK